MNSEHGVAVVVITHNDAAHLADAVDSALAQGDRVREVIVVDDASTDDTPLVLAKYSRDRVKVLTRTINSGGCGAPRNDGTAYTQQPWVAYLDSDDVLPRGAIDALLDAALAADADFATGLCIRRELPSGLTVPWEPHLFSEPGAYTLADRPQTLRDTLAVNKLYRRAFLVDNDIRFARGSAHYEDFAFSAQAYVAAARFAITPAHVYTWNVRRAAETPSISLRRDNLKNWRDRTTAHEQVLDIMRDTGNTDLVVAAEHKFLHHDLMLYLRDLYKRTEEYQRGWWDLTRKHFERFVCWGRPGIAFQARWAADLIRFRDEPVDLARLSELAATPPRLLPPYHGSAAVPTWDDRLPAAQLAGLAELPLAELPVDVDGSVEVRRSDVVLKLRVHDMYGRLADAGVVRAEVVLKERSGAGERTVAGEVGGGFVDGVLAVRASLPGAVLYAPKTMATWDLSVALTFRTGATATVRVRSADRSGLGRHVVPGVRPAVLLVQPYRTAARALSIRVAGGLRGAATVVKARNDRRRNAKG